MNNQINVLISRLAALLVSQGWSCTTAESCTGGLIAASMTAVAGSSRWFERSFVTYSNEAKQEMLGVDAATITQYGAVSEPTVKAMAEGAIANSQAHLGVAVSGIAGPGGGSKQKPVGTACIAWAGGYQPTLCKTYVFKGDREAIRYQTVIKALEGLITRADKSAELMKQLTEAHYFLALWPEQHLSKQLHQQISHYASGEAKPVCPEDMHLTLAYLGQVPQSFVDQIIDMLNGFSASAVVIRSETIKVFKKAKARWMDISPSENVALIHRTINDCLLALGHKPERRAFVPHITIERKSTSFQEVKLLEPIWTPLGRLCLARSYHNKVKPGPRYEIVKALKLAQHQ